MRRCAESLESPWLSVSRDPSRQTAMIGMVRRESPAMCRKDFRFRDLRHTTASMLAAQSASLLQIAEAL